jgi:plasmid stabilization system protein ParE
VTTRFSTPAAERDLLAAARWIALDNPASAEALLHAALTAARRSRDRPGMGRSRENLAPARYRFWSLSGFRTLMVHDTGADPPHIVRVAHTARDPPRALRDIDLPDL